MRKEKIMNLSKKSNEKLSNPSFTLKAIFWALVVVFVFILGYFVIPAFRTREFFRFVSAFGVIFFLLGIALIFFTIREKIKGLLKKFLILTGASAAGSLVSVFLHNAIYALFIVLFGGDFWERTGLGDEPFFFILALIICPIAFLVGVIGSIVLFIKKKQL